MVRKSYSCQIPIVSSSSDTTNSSSENSDSPLKKFNRLLRSSVARHMAYFKKNKRCDLLARGRSVSDAGLSSIADHDPELAYLDLPSRPLRILGARSTSALCDAVPTFFVTSAGGGSHIGTEEVSDGSDVERPRRNHLRVPSPAFVGHKGIESTDSKSKGSETECDKIKMVENKKSDRVENKEYEIKWSAIEERDGENYSQKNEIFANEKTMCKSQVCEENGYQNIKSNTNVAKSKPNEIEASHSIEIISNDRNKSQNKEKIISKDEIHSEKIVIQTKRSEIKRNETKKVMIVGIETKSDEKKHIVNNKVENHNGTKRGEIHLDVRKKGERTQSNDRDGESNEDENKLGDRKTGGSVTGSMKVVRWSIRRDSFPLVNIRNALLKKRNLSPENLWRRRSTGNFAAGSAGGGCGVPRSAPATPLQLEPQPRHTKHEKQAIKPLSGSAPSVRATGIANGTGDTTEGKQPSKARQKKFQRHFPQVGPEEKVLNYYSCALVGDLLLQGHLYITKNYFAFYSNVFGYVTKLLIPTTSVLRITKEKVARIIPNAVGVCTRDERHVFGSLLSRDSTYKLMTHVWKAARASELALPKTQDLRTSEVELDASEYSPEDDSSSAGDRLDAPEPPVIRRESEALITSAGAAAVIQPALLTGSPAPKPRSSNHHTLLLFIALLLALSATWLCYKLYLARYHPQDDLSKLSGEELYSELVRFRARLHGRAANELHTFLSSNLLLLSKVRQSLEALSGVILTDMAQELPADSVFS